jgi:thiol-disulfide isomerase/thioredoxin
MRINSTLILAALLLVAGCKEKKAEQFHALPFPDVQIPTMITGQQEAIEYMAVNYWNGLTDASRTYPSDSILVSGVRKSDVEQKFADWTAIMDYAGYKVWPKAVANLYDRALACERKDTSSQVLETFVELFDKYCFNANSPVRNEDIYHHFVARYASYEGLQEVLRGKYEREARLTGLNKVGSIAADFRFADSKGRIRNLHDIDAEMTLLFFSNPGCEACMQIITVLRDEPVIASLVAEGRLAVVNVYIDEDIQAWRSYMPIYPEEWYNGFDPDYLIRGEWLYNVRAIPSLYLLDKEKRVILKDAPENKVFSAIASY